MLKRVIVVGLRAGAAPVGLGLMMLKIVFGRPGASGDRSGAKWAVGVPRTVGVEWAPGVDPGVTPGVTTGDVKWDPVVAPGVMTGDGGVAPDVAPGVTAGVMTVDAVVAPGVAPGVCPDMGVVGARGVPGALPPSIFADS
jgi:hypothetical protein